MRNPTFTLCAIGLLASATPAQEHVAVWEGPAAGPGAIALYDPATGLPSGAPAELSAIWLLPFELAGRTDLTEFSPARARRFTDIAGASRVRLQSGVGSLYHFVRAGSGGSASFGFLLVSRSAEPRILIERAGIGAGGGRNPFHSQIAVAPDGLAFLVATQAAGGGDLLEIETSGAFAIHERTAAAGPARIFPWGLQLGANFGVAVTNFGVLRFDRTTGAQAALIGFGADAPPTYFSGILAASNDTSHVVFAAGTSAQMQHVYSAGASGDARRATQTAGPVMRAGTALDGHGGPWLAVSDDGVWCAWRTTGSSATGQVTHECMVARAQNVPAPAEQLSSDARFLDTLDEVALFAFRGPARLLFGVGEQNPGGLPGKLDLFSVDLQAGAVPQFQNLTLTSGDATVPFTAVPTLKPSRAVLLPDGSGIVLHDDSGSSGDMSVWRDGVPGLQTVLGQVKDLDTLDIRGPGALFAVRRDGGARELYRGSSTFLGAPTLVTSTSSLTWFERPVARGDGWTGYIERDLNGERLARIDTASGALDALLGGPALFGPAIGWSANGSLLFTRIQGSYHAHIAWPLAARPVRLLSNGSAGQILPAD
ncbi:MAG: hypothetical protein JNL28_15690 [Planctomycetes bacterium]|nr:hypothetical protein [Planctomycetota bacterium]